MEPAGSSRRRDARRPAEGERSAVVGFSGQYRQAARAVLGKLTTLDWIRVADPDAGAADDFQFQAGATRYAMQIKWAQYPGSFGWAELTNPSAGEPALITRLAHAWQRIRTTWSGPLEVHLRTNEHASVAPPRTGSPLASCTSAPPRHFAAFLARSYAPIRDYLASGTSVWANLDSLPEFADWRPAWNTLRDATGLDRDTFGAFISDFVIQFGATVEDRFLRPDDSPEDPDIEHLAATLQALVADPSRPVELRRAELLDRLGWGERLRFRHPHAFPVPAIYTANEAARQGLRQRIDSLPGGYVALVGPAGAGKSTLLASVSWNDRRVVRYYAFVPDAPDPLSGRGEADSFLHDVTLALEEAGLPRRGYGSDLRGQRAVLQRQLNQAGERWRDLHEVTVIVVDGIDHVPREQNPSRSFLEELPSPNLPEGVFVILGTQTTGILPRPIREALAADGRTVEVPPLSREQVLSLADAAGPGDWLLPGQRDRLVTASEGHPLALTYILQELSAIETSEPDAAARASPVDVLLNDASKYGREVESRYRGYLLAAGTDPELLDLLAAIARLRTTVNLDWLKTWVRPRVLDEFVIRTSTFFRRDNNVWRFIHNSFRRFLIEETARAGDSFDPARDRALHIALADACANSPAEWALYRDEELAHRYLAGQYEQVIDLASPPLLRSKLFELRPTAVARDHAHLALRAAAETDDLAAFVRTLLFLNELWQRDYVLEPEKLAEAMVAISAPARSLEHIVAGGELRVPVPAALRTAARFARVGQTEEASLVMRAVGGLPGIVQSRHRTSDHRDADVVADWAEVMYHLSGLQEVLAQLDDQLPLPAQVGEASGDHPAPAPEDVADLRAAQRRRDQDERKRTVISCRNLAHARCFDLASGVRDEERVNALQSRIDSQETPTWQARASVVRALAACDDGDPTAVLRWARNVLAVNTTARGADEDTDDEEATRPLVQPPVVPLHLRLIAALALIRVGLADASEIDQLVPTGTMPSWPTDVFGREGLRPYETLIDFWRLRVVRAESSREARDQLLRIGNLRDAGDRRFYVALRTLSDLEGRHLAASAGRGPVPDVAAEADPIIRLFELPSRQTHDWTGWYRVRSAASDLYRRLARLANASGPTAVVRLLDRFTDAWNDPHRSGYWSPLLRQHVLDSFLDASPAVAGPVREQLARLEEQIAEQSTGPHECAELWLSQASAWGGVRDWDRAEHALQTAIRGSFGPGAHDDDRQLAAWLQWFQAAIDGGALPKREVVSIAQTFARRLAAVHDPGWDVAEAAGRLVELVWPVDPTLSAFLAESLCDAGVIEEADAIEAVLLGAVRDSSVPVGLAATATAELLIPVRKDPPEKLRVEIERRQDPATEEALAMITQATAVWSVTDARDSDDEAAPAARVEPMPTERKPTSVLALLAALREADPGDTADEGWERAVDAVADELITTPVAAALLGEASRLRIGGEALGGLAAMAASVGLGDQAADVLSAEMARTPSYGWIGHYDGGSRLNTFRAALRHRDPSLVRLAARDLAGSVSSGGISGHILPRDLRRIVETIGGTDATASAWPHVAEYLDVFAPPGEEPADIDRPIDGRMSAVEALLRWVSGYFGHPVRPLDFGSRRFFQAALNQEIGEAHAALAAAAASGGWTTEAALHVLATLRKPLPNLSAQLAAEISAAAACGDAICGDLARRLCSRYKLAVEDRRSAALPETYRLALPPLPERSVPEVDAEGVPHIELHDPQQVVAPFDTSLIVLARMAGLSDEAVLHRAASIATALDLPWIRLGHRAHAGRLKSRGQRHSYRPWAFMAGRRALGAVLTELLDAEALGTPPPLPAYHLGLIDEVLIHVGTVPLDTSTPLPWRRPDTSSFDVRRWCDETEEAARAYAPTVGAAETYVLGEYGEWVSVEWGEPAETRMILAGHRTATEGGLVLPERERWERTIASANRYLDFPDLDWTDEQLIVEGWERVTDPPWFRWIALHPAVAERLSWEPDDTKPLSWRGHDGEWRATTVHRARGQLSHQPPADTYCADVWQVVLSDAGIAELRDVFGPVERELDVRRKLPERPRDGRAAEEAQARVMLTEPG